jgi:hypothetical protein
MANLYGPRIVTDGLVLYVDPANKKSYPGSGSTLYDLSGNGHNFSLGSSVTFLSNVAKGVLNLPENSTGYVRNTTIDLRFSSNTVITFTRKNSYANNGRVITAYYNNWLLGHHDTTYGDYYAQGWVHYGSGSSDTTWRMFTGTRDSSIDRANLYINTSLIINSSAGADQGPYGFNINNQYSQYSNAQMSVLMCYNRVLDANEVAQNYNALKGRFGL